jgi:hypothetical protein
MRFHDLRSIEQLTSQRLRIWAIKVDLENAIKIDFSNAKSFGIEPTDLVADDHTACRRMAEEFRAGSWAPEIIIVPSAALPGTQNIVIFGERTAIPYSWSPIDPDDLPTCTVAEMSQPPPAIADLVCFRGGENPEYEAWASGRQYAFPDLP